MSCVDAIGDATDTKEMLRRAFVSAKNHFMVLDSDAQFKGALNAVLTKLGDGHPDKEKLTAEIRLLGQFSAWLHAAQAGLHVDPPEVPENAAPFGIMKLWHEVRGQQS